MPDNQLSQLAATGRGRMGWIPTTGPGHAPQLRQRKIDRCGLLFAALLATVQLN
jgi:hypothetical protein